MSKKLFKKDNKFLARIVTEDPKPCAFCHRKVDDELNYGKLYAIGDIQCHYFCALLSCCLVQKGSDDTGLFGFQYKDILAELERCKKHRCSYCGQGGANMGCCVTACRKQFHLPCGREKHAVSLFYGTYKSFCQLHAPKQKLPDHIMANARRRKQLTKAINTGNCAKSNKELETSETMVCVICYETVDGFPTLQTFWPPCCARDAWYHRTCVQRMALSAGMHYLKCPLCNDKEIFYEAVIEQGYYVPDRDAAWELEQNAFSEIYDRNIKCDAELCHCPMGRNHDAENGPWDIKLCLLCGSIGRHLQCIKDNSCKKEIDSADNSCKKETDTVDHSCKKERDSVDDPCKTGTDSVENPCKKETDTVDHSCKKERDSVDDPCKTGIDSVENPCKKETDTVDHSCKKERDSVDDPCKKEIDSFYNSCKTGTDSVENSSKKETESVQDTCKKETQSKVIETFICPTCEPIAPADLNALAKNIEAVIQEEQARAASTNRHGPVMPSRMSLRRTKGRNALLNRSSSSRIESPMSKTSESTNITTSRLDLNLKPPRKPPTPRKRIESLLISFSPSKDQNRPTKHPFSPSKDQNRPTKHPFSPSKDQNIPEKDKLSPSKDQNRTKRDQFSPTRDQNRPRKRFSPSKCPNILSKDGFSPSKVIQGLEEKLLSGLNEEIVEKLRRKIMKPRPLCVKKKIVNETLENLLNSSPKQKDPVWEWCSPKKHELDDTTILENEITNKENLAASDQTKTPVKENPIEIDAADCEDSNSTFQLPPEFIADIQSDDSFNFDTPKRKTVDIKQDSSLEIFEKDRDHSIGIDVIKMEDATKSPLKNLKSPSKSSKASKDKIFKFSPLGKELVDVEDFKKEYLNEVGLNKVPKCPPKVRAEIDFEPYQRQNDGKEVANYKRGSKRRRSSEVPKEKLRAKRRKLSESDLVLQYRLTPVKNNENDKLNTSKTKRRKKNKRSDRNLRVTFDSDSNNKKTKLRTKLSVDNKNIKLKIKWKKEKFHLKLESNSEKTKITKTKSQKSPSNLKQYVLQYATEGKSNDVLVKPEIDVNPLKRKYNIKQEKSPDKFKQTSLHSFFKVLSPK